MGTPIPLQVGFAGMQQDSQRDEVPAGAVWNMVDWIPVKLAANLLKRGGWAYGSPALGSTTYVQGLVRTPAFGAGEFNLAVGSDGHVYKFTNGTDSDIGTAFAVSQNPVVHRISSSTWLVVIPAASGSTNPKSWDGTTFQDLAGSPPQAIYADVWNDHTLLANGTVSSVSYPGRLWFSAVGNAASWDTTNSWWDFDLPVVGLAILRNSILAFHARTTSRLTGTTPPNAATISDLVEDDPFPGQTNSVGCLDARSIVHYGDTVIWADYQGIYQTDGTTLTDLTTTGGIAAYWRGLLVNGFGSIASGVFKDILVVSILDNSQNPIDCLCYDLERGFWYRFSNFPGMCFMSIPGVKTYMGLGHGIGRVADIETAFHQQSATDADGTAVTPLLETPMYRGFMRLHRKWIASVAPQQWLRLYLDYEMIDGGATPTLTVSYTTDALDPKNVTYTALSPNQPASTLTSRTKMDVHIRARGIAFKIQQNNASTDTMLRAIESEFYPLEVSRLGG